MTKINICINLNKRDISKAVDNNPRKDKLNLAARAMKPAPIHLYDSLLEKELGLYESSNWWPTDETLVKK